MVAKESIKISKVRSRGYVSTGENKILTFYFLVSKVEDIRMV